MIPEKQLFTTSEAADALNVSRATVIRLCNKGLLGFQRNSRLAHRMITRAAITEFLLCKPPSVPQVINPHVSIEGTTDQLTKDVRLMLLELRRRPDFNMESIRDVIS